MAGSLPYILSPFLTDTTLLSSADALVYAAGGALAANQKKRFYFTGRPDNFDATKPSSNSLNGRLDPEGIRVSNDGLSVFITDEYGPYVYQFVRCNGCQRRGCPDASLSGVAFGPDMAINGVNKHTLFIANDNDFLPKTPEGLVNPNQFFVFSIDESDLPSYVKQPVAMPFGRDRHDRG